MRNARRQPVWQPLRAAIALLVSHDEPFARAVGQKTPSKNTPLQATLPGNLRDAMEADGALVLTEIGVRSTAFGEQARFEYIPSETYQGRFDRMLRDFREQSLSIEDFAVARMADAGKDLAVWISEGWLAARDDNGAISPSLASGLVLDWERDFENGPPHLIMRDTAKRRRRHIEVNWPQLLACMREQPLLESHAEPENPTASKAHDLNAERRGSISVSEGPITRPSPVDPLELESWPLACVLAWIDAEIRGLSLEERDILVRQACKSEARALPIDTMPACRKLLDFAAANPDRLKLRYPGGIIEPTQLGPDAVIFPTEDGGKLTFAFRPHIVIRNIDDIRLRVLGIWCHAREVRAAWPDRNMGAASPVGAKDIALWKPTWLSLAGAIMWLVTRDMTLTKSTDQRPNNDHGILRGISAALAMEQFKAGKPVRKHFDVKEAWPAIRQMIADEKIFAEARSLESRGLSSRIETRFDSARIPSGDVGILFISNAVRATAPKDALAPNEDYRFHNGQGRYWYDVRVRADDVFREFPVHHIVAGAGTGEREKAPEGRDNRRGRKPGDGSYDAVDNPILQWMKTLIDMNFATSPHAAADLLQCRTIGASPTARKDRLHRKYKKWQAAGFPDI